jgi:hypothetical protein
VAALLVRSANVQLACSATVIENESLHFCFCHRDGTPLRMRPVSHGRGSGVPMGHGRALELQFTSPK